MSKTNNFVGWLIAVACVALSAIAVEQRANACGNGKACTKDATCNQDCTQEVIVNDDKKTETYVCRKTVSVGDAGKVCDDSDDEDDDCENSTQVVCGTTKSKSCAKDNINCDSPLDSHEAKISGCPG